MTPFDKPLEIGKSEYDGLVRDATFGRIFAEILAKQAACYTKNCYVQYDETVELLLRAYDRSLIFKEEQPAHKNEPRTAASVLAGLMRSYEDNHGEEGENA
ncbi:MAG: hypothetical protein IKV00_05645 [Clostridia bacterium]|nr:hypothetical protein [Clostridia bacterium]